jgi:hypothetical protein
MTIKYTHHKEERLDGIIDQCIIREDAQGNKTFIPLDPANSDYQHYLNPEAEQSTPSLTDETSTK